MIRTKITIGVLFGIVGALVMILVINLTPDNKNVLERNNMILHHFNKVDVDRLNEMV